MPYKSTEAVKRWRKAHPDAYRALQRQSRRRRRIRAMILLSQGAPRCACCGWTDVYGPNRLEFDHINGGGRRLTRKTHSADLSFKILRGESGFRLLCRACNAIIEPGSPRCILHPPGIDPALDGSIRRPSVYRVYTETGAMPGLTKPSPVKPMPTISAQTSPTQKTRDLTTIQLSTVTRNRLYRLKFRKTYDQFLSELCDSVEKSVQSTEIGNQKPV